MWKGLCQLSYLEKIHYKSARGNSDGQGSSNDPLSPSATLKNIPAFPVVPETPGVGRRSLSYYFNDLHNYFEKASNDNVLDLAKNYIKELLWKNRESPGFKTLKEYFSSLTEEEKTKYNPDFIKIIDECLKNYKKEDSTSTPGPRPQNSQNLQPPDFFPPPTDAIPTLFPSNPRKISFDSTGGNSDAGSNMDDRSDADSDSGSSSSMSSNMNDESDSSSMDSDAVPGSPH